MKEKVIYVNGQYQGGVLFRCTVCGKLLGDKMIARGDCAGHKMICATSGTIWEWVKIKMGRIK